MYIIFKKLNQFKVQQFSFMFIFINAMKYLVDRILDYSIDASFVDNVISFNNLKSF